MSSMFYNCENLTTIFVSESFVTNNVTGQTSIFTGCTSLVGGNGTVFDSTHVNKLYARIDRENEPGYFTLNVSEKKIKDVVALSSPSRLIYNVGETVDLTGLSVRIIYEDDTSTDLSYNSDNANLWTVKTNLLKTSDKISDREFVTVKFNGRYK